MFLRRSTTRGRKTRLRRGLRLRVEPLEDRRLLTVYTVDNTNDSGSGSLRQAILDANGHSGADEIDFNISGGGVHTIQPSSALPTVADTVTIDGFSQSGATANSATIGDGSNTVIKIVLDGGSAGSSVDGLVLGTGSDGSTIQGLAIGNFDGYGITVSSAGDLVAGNYVGTDAAGTAAAPNAAGGVLVSGGLDNVIGGFDDSYRNVISGNGGAGVTIINVAGSIDEDDVTFVLQNLIGVDATLAALGNDAEGVLISGSSGTYISTNIISANEEDGVHITSEALLNAVQANYIGSDPDGDALGNSGNGILIDGGSQVNVIGTLGDDDHEVNITQGNFIADNHQNGISITGSLTNTIFVGGNRIGTVDGTTPLGNHLDGVALSDGTMNNFIGLHDDNLDEQNLISGNQGSGISVTGVLGNIDLGQMDFIIGNLIGLSIGGDALGNQQSGVLLSGSSGVIVNSNTIGANGTEEQVDAGVYLTSGSLLNAVQANYIGTNSDGDALGNLHDGILIDDGSQYNVIGSLGDDDHEVNITQGNYIADNGGNGVWITGSTTGGNWLGANFIGTLDGSTALPNLGAGVKLSDGTTGNSIGVHDGNTDERNVISGNSGSGVLIDGSETTSNVVAGNYIGTTSAGTSDLANGTGLGGGDGIRINHSSGNTIGGDDEGGADQNVISGNAGAGVHIVGSGAVSADISDISVTRSNDAIHNHVLGNIIGLDADGSAPVANGGDGILIEHASQNLIGGATAAARNVISGNGNHGVAILGSGTRSLTREGLEITGSVSSDASQNQVTGNYIGINAAGTGVIGNTGDGVYVSNGLLNRIGGAIGDGIVLSDDDFGIVPGDPDLVEPNVISGNGTNGVHVTGDTGFFNFIQSSRIGTDPSGDASFDEFHARLFGNVDDGVLIDDGAGFTIVGTLAGHAEDADLDLEDPEDYETAIARDQAEGNIISGNGHSGVHVDGPGLLQEEFFIDVFVSGNHIGTNGDGTQGLGNGAAYQGSSTVSAAGVEFSDGAKDNIIGADDSDLVDHQWTHPVARNVISANYGPGVWIHGVDENDLPGAHRLNGNLIGTDETGTSNDDQGVAGADTLLGNRLGGVLIEDGNGATIGGHGQISDDVTDSMTDMEHIDTEYRNIISGNIGAGITLTGAGTYAQISTNYIGTDIDATGALANTGDGILVEDGAFSLIGLFEVNITTRAGAWQRNVIAGNGGNGITAALSEKSSVTDLP